MITEAGPLNLRMGPAGLSCKVHPSVLVTICDSYIRRPSGARRVIGTLLGNAIEDSVYVKACYTEISEEDENQVCSGCPSRGCSCPHNSQRLPLRRLDTR